jgi:pimeloyl-ACP methyl ester carboxylesterase
LAAAVPLYEAGDPGGAIDAFLDVVLGPGEYKSVAEANLPAGWHDRAVAGAGTFFRVEFPAFPEWQFTPELAGRITQPVLSVVGALSDPFFREGDALIREWIPQSETFVLPGASHGLQFMNPGALATGLVAFLEKHPMRVPATA